MGPRKEIQVRRGERNVRGAVCERTLDPGYVTSEVEDVIDMALEALGETFSHRAVTTDPWVNHFTRILTYLGKLVEVG